MLTGGAVLAAFVAWERRTPEPLVRFGVLAVPSLRAATLGAAVNSVAFTAIAYVGTLYLQDELGYGPLTAGLALLPLDVVAFVVSVGAGHLIRRAYLPAAFALSAVALAWLARAPAPVDYAIDLLIPLVLLGVTLPVAFVALTNEAVADGAGFAVGAGLALLGILVTRIPNVTSPNVSSAKSSLTWEAKRR